jgi:hypothetical protein
MGNVTELQRQATSQVLPPPGEDKVKQSRTRFEAALSRDLDIFSGLQWMQQGTTEYKTMAIPTLAYSSQITTMAIPTLAYSSQITTMAIPTLAYSLQITTMAIPTLAYSSQITLTSLKKKKQGNRQTQHEQLNCLGM